MDSYSLYREHIGKTLTLRLADAMEHDAVTEDQAAEIADEILKGVDGAQNHEELLNFLETIAHKWTIFGPLLVAEQSEQVGQVVAEQEHQAVDQIEGLLKENKIDEAIQTAENATQETETETASLEQPTLSVSDQPQTTPNSDNAPPANDLPAPEVIAQTPPTAPPIDQNQQNNPMNGGSQ